MKQQTLAVGAGFERFSRQSRRAEFLSQMDVVVPWAELVALVRPHYPDTGKGRPPVGIERMLRIYFLPTVSVALTGLRVRWKASRGASPVDLQASPFSC